MPTKTREEQEHHKTDTKIESPISLAASQPLASRTQHPLLALQKQIGNRAVTQWLQTQLKVGAANDEYEREAEHVAEEMMHGLGVQRQHICTCGGECPECKAKQRNQEHTRLQTKRIRENAAGRPTAPPLVHEVLRAPGRPLDPAIRAFAEQRFGHDFGRVRVHTDAEAADSAQQVNALAYTSGRDIVFNEGQYSPQTDSGKKLLAHELTHVVQQDVEGASIDVIQRADLTSPRLAGNPLFEDILDNKAVIEFGDSGPEVKRIQQLLIDLGFNLSARGADGLFRTETRNAVKAFQVSKGLNDDGRVGFSTIDALDKAFPAFALPASSTSAWTMPCVLGILCPWNKHLVENVLPTFNIITFDTRSFPTETWNGASWDAGTFTSGGFRGGNNMGFLNTTTCEQFAFTVYHEGWHAQQPSSLTGVVEIEKDAYINAEQWSISMGIPGQTFTDAATGTVTNLRTTSIAGETIVDEAAAEKLVRQEYGGVSSVPGERILSRVGASDVKVRKPDGTEYTRPAQVGERVRGAVTMTNQKTILPTDWDCP
jgi:peptidoglycan hydrolase-like protein with peptidoglycan-binding domain